MQKFITSISNNKSKVIIAFLFFSIIFIWFTYPLVLNFDNTYTGSFANSDTHQYYWNIYNFKQNLRNLINPFYTDMLFFPYGSSLVMHTYTPAMSIFGLLFSNNFLALNLFLYLNYTLSALGVYLLCRHFKSGFLFSILSGIIYGFCPYKMIRLTEHYHLLLTAGIPFFVLFFLKAFEFNKGRLMPEIISFKYFLYCICFGFIIVLSDYYSTFSIMYFCLIYGLFFKYVSRFNYRSTYFWVYTISFIVICHIVLHQFKVFAIDNKGGIWWSGDILSYFIPPENSRWLNFEFFRTIENSIYHYPQSVEYCMFVGFTVLFLIIFSFFLLFKNKISEIFKPLIFVVFIFFLMTVPDVKFAGKSLLNTPVSFLHYIPFLNNLRSPTRMFPMLLLVILPITAFTLSEYLKNWNYKNFIILLIIIIAIFEYKPKNYNLISENQAPEMVKFLSKKPQGALLNIPFGVRDGFDEIGKFETKKLFYQTIHNKPMADGYISRLSKKLKNEFNTDFYKTIVYMQTNNEGINKAFELPEKFRYIMIEQHLYKIFEPFFDRILKKQKIRKFHSSSHVLYQLY